MLVSIIIPCFNAAKDISECIDSVLAQTYKEIEIILVDNNSRDHTLDILMKYQKRFPLKIKVEKALVQGAPAARNKGLSLAKGEWLQFLDADDILLPMKIEEQASIVKKNGNLDLIISNYLYQLNSEKQLELKYSDDNLWLSFLSNKLGITSCYLWRKELMDKVGGWDENMHSSQEYELLFEFLKVEAQIGFDEKFNTLVRRRPNSISTQSNQFKIWETLIDQRFRVKAFLKENKLDFYNKYEIEIDIMIVEHLSKLGLYDLNLASTLYENEILTKPKLTKNTNGKFHKWSYNILGFKMGTIVYKNYLKFLRLIKRYDY